MRYLIGGSLQVAQSLIHRNDIRIKQLKKIQKISIIASNLDQHKKCAAEMNQLSKPKYIKQCQVQKKLERSAINNYMLIRFNQQKQCTLQELGGRLRNSLSCRSRANSVTS